MTRGKYIYAIAHAAAHLGRRVSLVRGGTRTRILSNFGVDYCPRYHAALFLCSAVNFSLPTMSLLSQDRITDYIIEGMKISQAFLMNCFVHFSFCGFQFLIFFLNSDSCRI